MDLNGDGHADILSGSYSRYEETMAGLFQVLWGNAEGEFNPAATLNGTDEKPLIISAPETSAGYDSDLDRICTRPVAIDWDSDGALDLISGNFHGTFCLFRGEGQGKFLPTSELLMIGNDVLRIAGHHSDPFCIDWDKDGDVDLLSGSTNGGAQWAENTAGAGKLPVLKAFVALIEPGPQAGQGDMLKESELTGPTRSTRIWVDDINEDGKFDILVGDSTTLTSPADGLTEEECKAKEVEWKAKMEDLSKKLRAVDEKTDAAESEKIHAEFSTLYQGREAFIKEDRTGFVWMYLQK